MHKYNEYKNSDIEWIGQIPSHWNTIRLKYLCSIETGDKDTINAVDDGVYPFFVRSQTIEKINSYTKDCEAVLTAGDGVGVGKVFHYINGKFDFHQRVYMFNKFKHITGKYFFTYLLNNFYKVVLDGNAKNTVDSLRLPLISNFIFTIPPIYEQYEIDNYLDQQTAKIDELVQKQNKLIDLLHEKKKSLINHVVTNGLNPDVQMKDSGIEWLGQIPLHWQVKKLKHVGTAIIGLTYSPDDIVDDTTNGILVLRSSNVQEGVLSFEDNVYVNMDIPKDLLVQENDILICSRNGSRALIGKNAKIDKSTVGCTFGAFMTIFRSNHNNFIYYILNSSLFDFQSSMFLTSTINQLTTGNLNNFEFPLPSREEQKQIAEYLDKQTVKIDQLINKAKSMVELLKEHKQSLINNVVTGKIKVTQE